MGHWCKRLSFEKNRVASYQNAKLIMGNKLNITIKQLRETLGKMEAALDALEEAIVWTDEKGAIQWCNAPFDKLVEQSHINLLGANLSECLPLQKDGHPLTGDSHPVHRVLESRSNIAGVYKFRRGKQVQYLEILSNLVEFDTNLCIVLRIQNITKRKQNEDKLIRQKEELSRSNAELERFRKAAVGREERIIELKEKINTLSRQLGEDPPHDLSFVEKELDS